MDKENVISKECLRKAMTIVNKAAEQSLDPENFENLCEAFNVLSDTRRLASEDGPTHAHQ